MKRRVVEFRELWAIDPRAIQRDADAIFVLFGPHVPPNEYREDGVAVVHILGPMDHHRGFGDNYDEIRERMSEAFECEDTHCVIARIDSPGGVVAGLLDTARAIKQMAEESGKRAIAYVDEHSFSAAYALASAFDEIVLPPSALLGSIGVISTMADQVERDKAMGYNFVTVTSGARKADGHIHVPITDAAIAAEQRRVDKLARQFFGMVSESRGLTMKEIDGFEAGLFLGKDAVNAGLADRVATFDELISELADVAHTGTYSKKPVAQSGTPVSTLENEAEMKGLRATLLERLKTAKTALTKARAAKKPAAELAKLEGQIVAYESSLEAYKKVTEKHVEHSKTHEEDEDDEEGSKGNETDRNDDEDDDEDEDEDEDKESEASAPKRRVAARKYEEDDEEEDEAEDEEEAESEEDEAEAVAALVRRATGKTGVAARGAFAALVAKAKNADAYGKRLATIERERAGEKRDAVVDGALAKNRITKREAKELRGKPMAYVSAFLEARPRALIATEDGEGLLHPDTNEKGQANLPPELEKMLQQAMAASDGKITREQFIEDYNARNAKMQNGRGGPI